MGEVFAAVRTGPGGFRRQVALKRLVGDEAVRGSAVQRFLAEARILSSLHHPNVIEVYDVIAGDGGYVLVMELLTGATLGALAKARADDGGLPVAEIAALADQALAGLAYVHAARGEDGRPLGLVHRDLTPNNLFVTDAGEVKLIDFGIAKLRAALDAPVTREGEIHGTLELIAPEQARGDPPDPRTDLYQLAGSLYWALTGKYPHGTGTTIELITRAAMVRPPRVAELRRDVPAALAVAIDRAMELEPADRFPDAQAMRAALGSLVPSDGEARLAARVRSVAGTEAPAPSGELAPTEAPTVGERPSARASAGRRRWPFALAAAIAAAGAATGGALWLLRAGSAQRVPHRPLPEVPGGSDAFAAAPLDGGRIAIATADTIATLSEHGGDERRVEIPAGTAPVDVEPLAAGKLAVTVQRDDGELDTYVAGSYDRPLFYHSTVAVTAVSPDGAHAVRADRGDSAVLAGYQVEDRPILTIQSGAERVVALAWSPDGTRIAAIHERWQSDPAIELVDVASGNMTTIAHAPFDGEVTVFGWLDADHLAYAVNHDDDATVYRFTIATRAEDALATLPGELVVGGHVAAGAIALLHGVPRRPLLLGTASELHAEPIDEATWLGGTTPDGRLVFARPDGSVVARAGDGTVTPWADSERGDRPEATFDGDLLASRAGTLRRLGTETTQLITPKTPRGTAPLRCAGDTTAPCVVAVPGARIAYQLYDPQRGMQPGRLLANVQGVDHALSRDAKRLAVVNGTSEMRVYNLDQHDFLLHTIGRGAALDGVAWVGDHLIVSARHYKQHAWALLAVDGTNEPRVIAEAKGRVRAELRTTADGYALAATDVTPILSVLRP